MPTTAKSHLDIRELICGLCLKKPPSKPRLITAAFLILITTWIYASYCLSDLRLPTAVCDSCRIKFTEDKVNFKAYKYESIPKYINRRKVKGHKNGVCDCILCNTYRVSLLPGGGRKRKRSDDKTTIQVCKRCRTKTGRGKSHNCTPSQYLENSLTTVSQSQFNTKAGEQLCTQIILRKVAAGDSEKIVLSNSRSCW